MYLVRRKILHLKIYIIKEIYMSWSKLQLGKCKILVNYIPVR